MSTFSSTRIAIAGLSVLLLMPLLGGCLLNDKIEPDNAASTRGPNKAPTISGAPTDNVFVDETYSFTPKAADANGDALSFSITNKPKWAKFNKVTGRISGTPADLNIGVSSNIRISVSDGEFKSTLRPFEIEVLKQLAATPPARADQKYNPGHYIAMNRSDDQSDMIASIKPGVVGLQKRYFWNELEPMFDVYDFAGIRSDLELLHERNMKLVIFVVDTTYQNGIATPAYLDGDDSIRNVTGGYTAKRWSPFVVERFRKLMLKLGDEFDAHPAFEGVAIQGSSLSLSESTLTETGYTTTAYRNALVDVLVSAAASFPRSQVFWHMDFFPRGQDNLVDIANVVGKEGVIMGGAAVLPDNDALTRLTYPIYDDFDGRMTLFGSMKNDSYSHEHADRPYEMKYWTLQKLYEFACDELHVSYLFWNRKTEKKPADSYDWQDALPVIANNPVIRPPAVTAETTLTVKPASAARLVVDPNKTIRAYIPASIYSVNMQYNVVDIKHWERDNRRIKPTVMNGLKSLPGGMYRYPGGLPSNGFNWQASVVDYDRRVEKRLAEGNLSVNTFFGVGEYLQFVKDVGASAPWFTLNLIGGGTFQRPIEWSSAMVANSNQGLARYIVERTPEQSVRYYQLGNELDRNQYQWSYNKYVSRSRDTINRISAVDPKARFVPFMREYNWKYEPPKWGTGRADEYFDVVMKGLPMVKDFSLHYYFDGRFSPDRPFMTVPQVIDNIYLAVEYAKAARDADYSIWITEYGKRFYLFGNTPPESGTSLDAALGQGDFLIALAQMPVVKGAMMQGFDGGERKLYYDSDTPTSSYWALRILSGQPYKRVLASQTYSPNLSAYPGGYDVRAVAFTNDAGDKLGVSAVNRSRRSTTIRIEYPPLAGRTVTILHRFVRGPVGANPKGVEKNITVQNEPIGSAITFDADGAVEVRLPALSVSAITFD